MIMQQIFGGKLAFAAAALSAAFAANGGEAKFIGAGAENGARPCYVRKEVVNEKAVANAEWRVAGLGVFLATVNVKPATSAEHEILMPGYTHFKKRRHEIALDVTGLWNKDAGATNALSAVVTGGWWCDGIAGKNGGTWPAFRGLLTLTFADGTTAQVPTDESWDVTTDVPWEKAGIWEGEYVDARKMKLHDENPAKAKINEEFKGEISPRIGPPIVMREDLTLCHSRENGKPIPFCARVKPGETNVVDFGQNCAGVPVFSVQAEPGTKVTIKLAEMLNDGIDGHHGDGPAGTVYMANMRGAKATVEYICQGQPRSDGNMENYHPLYTFYGYRYAAISADKPLLYAIASVPVSSISKEMEHGWVETGRDDVNRLVKNTYWGMLSNHISIPTDCPQRNERYGWTGDTQVFAKTGAYFADTSAFMRKWMQDVRDSQDEDGTVPLVCPIGAWSLKGPVAGWSDAAVIVPWTMWRQLGDQDTVRENWAAMEKFVRRVAQDGYTSKRGQWLLCDWLSFEKLTVDNRTRWSNGGYTDDHLAYQNFLNACHLLQDCRMMREMADVPGCPATPEFREWLKEQEDKTRERILANWFDGDGTLVALFDGMQTPALFALKLGLGDKEKIASALVDAIHANGDRLATGFLGTPLLCDVLSNTGQTSLAYTLLLQHDFPSWLYSVDQGATTIWERWDGYTKEKGFGPVSMNSFNHYSYGAVVGWLFEHAAGIRPDGENRFVVKPEPDERLGRISAKWRGLESSWEYKDGKVTYRVTVPAGATAHLILPDGRECDLGEGLAVFN